MLDHQLLTLGGDINTANTLVYCSAIHNYGYFLRINSSKQIYWVKECVHFKFIPSAKILRRPWSVRKGRGEGSRW
jgi:hypothetical protein